jgi:hypothetical protein
MNSNIFSMKGVLIISILVVFAGLYTVSAQMNRFGIDFYAPVMADLDNYPNPFPDLSYDQVEGKAAAELYRRGVIKGYDDGNFKGDRAVNRAELAKFLLLTKYGNTLKDQQNNGLFPDIETGSWYEKYVVWAYDLVIIEGYADGYFRPAKTVNTAEFLKMLTRAFEIEKNIEFTYADVDREAWYASFAGIAEKYKLFPHRGNELSPDKEMTRNEVAVAVYQYLKHRE